MTLVPVTEALKEADWPAPTNAEPGVTLTAIGTSVTVALADFVLSAALVAVTVTVVPLAITEGA